MASSTTRDVVDKVDKELEEMDDTRHHQRCCGQEWGERVDSGGG